jgi:predicted dehydrogenase
MMRMGGKATVTCSMGFPGHFLERDVFTQTLILVEGDAGSAELDRDYWIRVTTQCGTRANRHAPVWRPWMHPQYLASHASIAPCNANLLWALRGEGEPETTAEDNLKTVRLTFAAYESARTGRVVQINETSTSEREPVTYRSRKLTGYSS